MPNPSPARRFHALGLLLLLSLSAAAPRALAQEETSAPKRETSATKQTNDARESAPDAARVGATRDDGARADEATNATSSLPELVRRVKPAVVAILTYDAKGNTLLSGSGFFIRPGQVVTNLHVIEGARRAEVKTLDGKGRIYPVAGILSTDEEGDLALLSVNVPSERAHAVDVTTTLPEEGE
ncbi:MAG: S1C family serine protease, partial [Acidobacteriota bacterium]|nr:S1C family serine protease [Acidobacteriota bacterium]